MSHQKVRRFAALIFVNTILFVSACTSIKKDGYQHQASTASLKGGILVTFEAGGGEFNAWITNPDAIVQIYAVRSGEGISNIPYGKVLAGAGMADHNEPYNWHLDPNEFSMLDQPLATCNSDPIEVEQNLDTYLSNDEYFCPADASVIRVTDYRVPPPHILTGN